MDILLSEDQVSTLENIFIALGQIEIKGFSNIQTMNNISIAFNAIITNIQQQKKDIQDKKDD
jgi:hypothetical protein